MRILCVLALILFGFSANAEYRVYQLKITDTTTKKSREILTTLMPKAYIFYYPIRATEMVEIMDHWMCWKRSDGYQKPCTRPFASLEQSPKTGLTNSDQGKIPN